MNKLKLFWPHASLALLGLIALGCLFSSFLRPSPPAWDPAEGFSGGNRDQWNLLCSLGPRAVPRLLNVIRNQPRSRSDIVAALASLGPAAVPDLVTMFDDRDPRVRLAALRALAALRGDPELDAALAVPGLLKLLRDPAEVIRCTAAQALVRFEAQCLPVLPALIQALRFRDLDPAEPSCVPQIVAHILGKLGPEAAAALPALTAWLRDPSPSVTPSAAVAIWRISHDPNLLLPQLHGLANDPDPALRDSALAILQRMDRETTLHLSLFDPDPNPAKAAPQDPIPVLTFTAGEPRLAP